MEGEGSLGLWSSSPRHPQPDVVTGYALEPPSVDQGLFTGLRGGTPFLPTPQVGWHVWRTGGRDLKGSDSGRDRVSPGKAPPSPAPEYRASRPRAPPQEVGQEAPGRGTQTCLPALLGPAAATHGEQPLRPSGPEEAPGLLFQKALTQGKQRGWSTEVDWPLWHRGQFRRGHHC